MGEGVVLTSHVIYEKVKGQLLRVRALLSRVGVADPTQVISHGSRLPYFLSHRQRSCESLDWNEKYPEFF